MAHCQELEAQADLMGLPALQPATTACAGRLQLPLLPLRAPPLPLLPAAPADPPEVERCKSPQHILQSVT